MDQCIPNRIDLSTTYLRHEERHLLLARSLLAPVGVLHEALLHGLEGLGLQVSLLLQHCSFLLQKRVALLLR